ncbi:hypothetical protein [Arthrobacter sp. NEB 688]|uniref:hypothetical protein n=1 Tax=Arthrobacter sp. NEB 688 TaxID=904039 RepID=UPI00156423E0|nr:hypothetical protein [Arthrobacter sp. NEB 688]QKE82489.1 hypothetical protein HL663_02205 [Arthrobacter sp. NEB 688]
MSERVSVHQVTRPHRTGLQPARDIRFVTVSESHPELEWLARRRAGESVALIARRAGVSERAVFKATGRFGPFPPPDQHVGRAYLSPVLLEERRARWVSDRRRGVRVKEIAARDGVSHQSVTRATRDWGPLPSRESIEAWVEARQQRRSLAAIADEFGVLAHVVQRLTRPHGPFPRPAPTGLEGVETIESISRRIGLSDSVVRTKRHLLPEPDWVTGKGRPVWLPRTVDRWLAETPPEACETCGGTPSACRHIPLRPSSRSKG